MSQAPFSIEADTKRLDAAMRRFGAEFRLKKYLTLIGLDTLTWIDDNFKSEGKLVGGWKKNPRAIRRGKLLRDSGRMANSATHKVSRSANQVQVGFGDKKATWHHEGRLIKAKNAPYLMFKTPTGFAKKKEVTLPSRRLIPTKKLAQRIASKALTSYMRLLINRTMR